MPTLLSLEGNNCVIRPEIVEENRPLCRLYIYIYSRRVAQRARQLDSQSLYYIILSYIYIYIPMYMMLTLIVDSERERLI